MSNNWSLKGKRYKFFEDSYECYDWIQNDEYTYFKQQDIETLRQKLIEDIDTLDCTKNSKLKKWEIIEDVLEIIDKRFGVEE